MLSFEAKLADLLVWVGDFVFEWLKRAIIVGAIGSGGTVLDNDWIVGLSYGLSLLLGFWTGARITQSMRTGGSPFVVDGDARLGNLALASVLAITSGVGLSFVMAAINRIAATG